MIWIFTPKIWMRNENLRHFAKWKRSSQTLKFSQVLVQKSAHANFTFFKAEMRHLGWKNDNASLQRNLRCSCVFVCNSQENLRKIIRQSVTGSSWIFNHVQNPGAEDPRRDARENDEKLTDYFLIRKEKLMYASWNQIETWPEQKRGTPTHETMNTIWFRNIISRVLKKLF